MTTDESQKDNPVRAVEDVVSFAIMKAGARLFPGRLLCTIIHQKAFLA
jgi:hypothetical protein